MFLMAVGTVVLMTTGCQKDSAPINHGEDFAPEVEVRETTRLEQTQKAAGARDDATLYSEHFDGPGLSSLGTTKLDAMLADSHSANPMLVYLAIPDDGVAQERRESIDRYLQDRGGIKSEQIKFEVGPNPQACSPADEGLRNYDKTDTSMSGGASSSSGSSASSGATSH
jgi:hypothetical protein